MLTRYLSYACVDKAFLFLLDACLLPQAMSAQKVQLLSTTSVCQGQALPAPAACFLQSTAACLATAKHLGWWCCKNWTCPFDSSHCYKYSVVWHHTSVLSVPLQGKSYHVTLPPTWLSRPRRITKCSLTVPCPCRCKDLRHVNAISQKGQCRMSSNTLTSMGHFLASFRSADLLTWPPKSFALTLAQIMVFQEGLA